jgi:hypothetical protein
MTNKKATMGQSLKMGAIYPFGHENYMIVNVAKTRTNWGVWIFANPNLKRQCENSHLKNPKGSYRQHLTENQKPGCSQISYTGVWTLGLPQDHVAGSNG